VTEAEPYMGDDTGAFFSFANTATMHHHGRTEFFYLTSIVQVTKSLSIDFSIPSANRLKKSEQHRY